MCWCSRVFFRILVNLATRACTDFLHCLYKVCCCSGDAQVPQESKIREFACEDFFKDVDRNQAEKLLKDRQGGTFVIRPPRGGDVSSVGTLSVVQDGKVFHLDVRIRRDDGLMALGREKVNERCFKNLDCLIDYYVSNYLVLWSSDGGSCMTLLIPYREHSV